MNIFEILKNLYTNPSSAWIHSLDDRDITPVVIQRFISLNGASSKQARLLNKFVFDVPPKMYLSSAWSVLFFNGKKLYKAPFIRYPKKNVSEPKYSYVLKKVKRQFKMSDKDLKEVTPFLIDAIQKDPYQWFSYYGIPHEYWGRNNMDINIIKQYGNRPKPVEEKKGLNKWF